MIKLTKEMYQSLSSKDLEKIYAIEQSEYIDFEGYRYAIYKAQNGKSYIELDIPHKMDKDLVFIRETENRIYNITISGFGQEFDIIDDSNIFDVKNLGTKQRVYLNMKYTRK